jgi:phenylpropionate dioxygenase-like ring-hydroxylating dioxygenase large terminal subunit
MPGKHASLDAMNHHSDRIRFSPWPPGWYYLCRGRDLRPGPIGADFGRLMVVGFRNGAGTVSVLDGRCSHMGAYLKRGRVIDGKLLCPLHGWEYGGDGRCTHIPATNTIPPFACQTVYPSVEIGSHVLFFNAPTGCYPMPFFEGKSPEELLAARPFDLIGETPWYMIGANAFDAQHFRNAHDRTLVSDPIVDCPAPHARRIVATYQVTGDTIHDRLTRRFGGPEVRMAVTVWSGSLILVTASFRRATSYGMVFVRPLGPNRTFMRTIVWIQRGTGAVSRAVIDPLNAWIRRIFIREFMNQDAKRANGAAYRPATMIDADSEIRQYFQWLAKVAPASGMNDALDFPGKELL